jgi:hypothetical protein
MNAQEMSDIIYDTLFQNTQWPQFNPDDVTPLYSEFGDDDNYTESDMPTQYVDSHAGIIRFGYDGAEFEVTVRQIG